MSTTARVYFLKRDGRVIGPLSVMRLVAMRRAGEIGNRDLLSPDKVEWLPVAQQNWLSGVVPPPATSADPQPEETPPPLYPSAAATVPAEPPAVPPSFDPLYQEEPETEDGEPADPVRLAGYTLGLIWNSEDYLPQLYDCGKTGTVVATAVGGVFALLISLGATALAASVFPGVAAGTLLTMVCCAVPGFILALFLEQMSCRILLSPAEGRAGCREDLLLAIAILMPLVAAGAISVALWPLSRLWPGSAIELVRIFVWCHALINMTAAIRLGFGRFYGIRPRLAVWAAAVTLWIPVAALFLFTVHFFAEGTR